MKDDMKPEEMKDSAAFHWPESLEQGALPWEAAPSGIALLGEYASSNRRPTNRQVFWYWRLNQVADKFTTELHMGQLAYALSITETAPGVAEKIKRTIEGAIVSKSWSWHEWEQLRGMDRALDQFIDLLVSLVTAFEKRGGRPLLPGTTVQVRINAETEEAADNEG
jgi:hypothetical protein